MILASSPHQVDGSFIAEWVWAAVTVIAAVGILLLIAARIPHRPRRGGLVTGADNRYSTSRVIAVGWTLVVGWMVVTEAYITSRTYVSVSFSDIMAPASDLYFILLGGPYAAAAFALLSTQSKISQGTLTKVPADSPRLGDVVADDNGNVDTYDFQYTLFNLLAIAIVVFSFGAHPGHGLPDIPQFLALLTGGSALAYTVNKTVAATGPQIASVVPQVARVGDVLTISGIQLFPNQGGGAMPGVTIGGVAAIDVAPVPGSTSALNATVVDAPAGSVPLSSAGAVDVVVTPPLATPILLRSGVTIATDKPAITKTGKSPFTANAELTVIGEWLLAPGQADGTLAQPAAAIGPVTATIAPTVGDVKFAGSYTNTKLTLKVGDKDSALAGASGTVIDVNLVLKRGDAQTDPYPLKYTIP